MECTREPPPPPAMPRFQCGPLLRIRTPRPTCPTDQATPHTTYESRRKWKLAQRIARALTPARAPPKECVAHFRAPTIHHQGAAYASLGTAREGAANVCPGTANIALAKGRKVGEAAAVAVAMTACARALSQEQCCTLHSRPRTMPLLQVSAASDPSCCRKAGKQVAPFPHIAPPRETLPFDRPTTNRAKRAVALITD
jgi:hypothetical protein